MFDTLKFECYVQYLIQIIFAVIQYIHIFFKYSWQNLGAQWPYLSSGTGIYSAAVKTVDGIDKKIYVRQTPLQTKFS